MLNIKCICWLKEVNGLLQMIAEKSGYSMKTILKNFSEEVKFLNWNKLFEGDIKDAGGFWFFLCSMLRQYLRGEECSVVRNRAGLEVWH